MSGNASPAASDQRLQDILQKVETMAASLDGLDKSKLKVVVDDLAKVVDGKPPFTQVNGAFGETIGRLLDGRKTAFGILGTLATFLLGGASGVPVLNATNAGTIIGPILQAVGVSSPVLLPITIALTAWGVLGKVDKWVKTQPKVARRVCRVPICGARQLVWTQGRRTRPTLPHMFGERALPAMIW